MKAIRVLHITPSVRMLGARQSLLTLVKELAGTKYEPYVLVPRKGPLTEELDKRRIKWIELFLPPWRKGLSWLTLPSRVAQLRSLILEKHIDLIHCNEIYPNPHAVVASSEVPLGKEFFGVLVNKRRVGRPQIPIVTHNRLSVTPRMIKNYLLSEATRLIAVSEAASQDFAHCPWFAEKVRVVYNGVDFQEFEAAKTRRSMVRQRLGYNEDELVVASIGLLMPRKRPAFILEAARRILERVPQARFLFVGDTSPGHSGYRKELKSLAQKLGIDDKVQFLSFQDHIAEIFAAVDLNLLLSNNEGFGRVVIEAAALQVPTIGSNVGGIKEIIIDGQTGFLIGGEKADEDSVFWKSMDDFVEKAVFLLQSPQERLRMGQAAYEHGRRNFSSESYCQGVMAVFDEAIEEFRQTAPPW